MPALGRVVQPGVCQPWRNGDGSIPRIEGICFDSSDIRQREMQLAADESVAKSAEHRAVIERAEGGLMYKRGMDGDQAFLMLSALSQNANTKTVVDSREHHSVEAARAIVQRPYFTATG